MRVLVCGGRDYSEKMLVFRVLDLIHDVFGISVLIQGGANGADCLAKEWAQLRDIPGLEFPADWKTHGNAAGPIRNRTMYAESKPDLVTSFPGGRGTADMMSVARQGGTPILQIDGWSTYYDLLMRKRRLCLIDL